MKNATKITVNLTPRVIAAVQADFLERLTITQDNTTLHNQILNEYNVFIKKHGKLFGVVENFGLLPSVPYQRGNISTGMSRTSGSNRSGGTRKAAA